MKNRKSSELVTKEYLDEKNYVTKENLSKVEKRLNMRMDRIMKYLEFHLEPLRKFMADFAKFKDQTQRNTDLLMGKYSKFDDEYVILTDQYSEVTEKLDSHEIRIVKLEKRKTN